MVCLRSPVNLKSMRRRWKPPSMTGTVKTISQVSALPSSREQSFLRLHSIHARRRCNESPAAPQHSFEEKNVATEKARLPGLDVVAHSGGSATTAWRNHSRTLCLELCSRLAESHLCRRRDD